VVDDAQRLDPASAALVHQLVADRLCAVLATVRSGETAPDAIAGLWKDSLAERIELSGLSRPDVDELVAERVSGLAPAAYANRDIAARLVVSLRTVENHLSRVFVKLGVTSRRELPGALEREGAVR
jgi:DNA-binding NarL/FixJ family response regulator